MVLVYVGICFMRTKREGKAKVYIMSVKSSSKPVEGIAK